MTPAAKRANGLYRSKAAGLREPRSYASLAERASQPGCLIPFMPSMRNPFNSIILRNVAGQKWVRCRGRSSENQSAPNQE